MAAAISSLGDLVYLSALRRVPMGGAIAEADRDGPDVLLFGRQPGGLRGIYHAPTGIRVHEAGGVLRATVVGGRPGITAGFELFALPVAGRSADAVADDAVSRVSEYLAATTS